MATSRDEEGGPHAFGETKAKRPDRDRQSCYPFGLPHGHRSPCSGSALRVRAGPTSTATYWTFATLLNPVSRSVTYLPGRSYRDFHRRQDRELYRGRVGCESKGRRTEFTDLVTLARLRQPRLKMRRRVRVTKRRGESGERGSKGGDSTKPLQMEAWLTATTAARATTAPLLLNFLRARRLKAS